MRRPLDHYIDRLSRRTKLGADELAALRSIDAPLKAHKARWDLVRPGQRLDFACLVEDGIVGRFEKFANGERHTTAIHVVGDMCDLHSVAVPVAGWGITALTDCQVFEVSHASLLEVAGRYPQIAMAFWRDTIVDASILSKWVSVLSRLTARHRLAHFLCEYGCRMETAGLGNRADFTLPFTQEQIAEVLGITPVHVNRIFNRLRDENVISRDRRNFRVIDLPKLERIADFDDEYLLLRRS